MKFVTLLRNDLVQIFRDKTLFVFLFVPFILLVLIAFFVPYVTDLYPVVAEYHVLIMMFAGIQTSVMFGFIVSFLIIEEKDENVLQVIRVLPISPFYFVLYRLLFATAMSTAGAFLLIQLSGIAYPGYRNAVLLAMQYGLIAPLIALIVATFAQNKIEGMAYFKGVNLALILPVVSFFVMGWASTLFAIIPTWWTYHYYADSVTGEPSILFYLLGTSFYLMLLTLLFFQFKRRVFDR